MKVRFSSFRFQLSWLVLLAAASGLYCLSDGDCSLWTPDQQGYRLFEQAKYDQAAARFTDPLWQGISLFRQGEFDKAASLFAGYDTAEATFNQGNALVMQGKYEAATDRYARALQLKPGFEDARVNREIALARAAALKKEGGDMTGGKLGADEIVFDKGKAPPSAGEEQVQGDQEATDAERRSIWLRQVQTKPADFLRAKFAYQYATRDSKEK
ncbi:MAG: tetratricopeptide repeat protein [Pseudomonadota bacterium]